MGGYLYIEIGKIPPLPGRVSLGSLLSSQHTSVCYLSLRRGALSSPCLCCCLDQFSVSIDPSEHPEVLGDHVCRALCQDQYPPALPAQAQGTGTRDPCSRRPGTATAARSLR